MTVSVGQVIILAGVLLGNLQWLFCLVYALTSGWHNDALEKCAIVFVLF